MSRNYHPVSIAILKFLAGKNKPADFKEVKSACAGKLSAKDFYNYLFRLEQQEFISKTGNNIGLTPEGRKLLQRLQPSKDGVWKLVIFDIPEKQKYVRTVLRAKLKTLHFKKWQNSIWVTPFALDEEIEAELKSLGKKFFVRLIKSSDINVTDDLEKLFP